MSSKAQSTGHHQQAPAPPPSRETLEHRFDRGVRGPSSTVRCTPTQAVVPGALDACLPSFPRPSPLPPHIKAAPPPHARPAPGSCVPLQGLPFGGLAAASRASRARAHGICWQQRLCCRGAAPGGRLACVRHSGGPTQPCPHKVLTRAFDSTHDRTYGRRCSRSWCVLYLLGSLQRGPAAPSIFPCGCYAVCVSADLLRRMAQACAVPIQDCKNVCQSVMPSCGLL